MKIRSNHLLAALALTCSMTATAVVPFEPTTIVDGQFAEGTKWYSMTIHSDKYVVSDSGDADKITLNRTVLASDADFWCFEGDETNGFKIYNKQAGPTKVLATPKTMIGTTGAESYAMVKAESEVASSNMVDLYDFQSSAYLDGSGYYIGQHGTSYFMNKRGSYLAFWSTGKDAGSTFLITSSSTTIQVLMSTGSFTATNAGGNWASNWQSTATNPQININCVVNNMGISGDNIKAYGGSSGSSTYSINAGAGFIVTGFRFDFSQDGGAGETVTAYGQTFTSSDVDQTLSVTGLKDQIAQFTLSGGNKGIILKNFEVYVEKVFAEPEEQTNIFVTQGSDVVSRIPAVATASDGTIVVAADYRYSGSDIGVQTNGKLDLRYRYSTDNGANWSDIKTLVAGKGAEGVNAADNDMWVAFGDPVLVADRESSKMMTLSCCGNVSFQAGTAAKHQGIARFYSNDNGKTWEQPTDIASSIYALFNGRKGSQVAAMFIGSGKMTQSYTTKVGDYYRVYNAALVKLADGTYTNFVFYSDDFGATWKVLGGVDVAPIPSGGDEPKAEELPDGSILVSSRVASGRKYNIFTFTNTETGEGSWGTMAFSGSSNSGVVASSNACNGEVLILPVTRKSDNKAMFIALQSVPLHPSNRANVGIWYKGLESLSDFNSPATFAANWEGKHQASYMNSAYSTMTLQKDNKIGFVYEESTFGKDYTIVYKSYSLEDITDDKYEVRTEADGTVAVGEDVRQDFVNAGIEAKKAEVLAESRFGDKLGQLKSSAKETLSAAFDNYAAANTKDNYEAIAKAIVDAPKNAPVEKNNYFIRNTTRTGDAAAARKKVAASGDTHTKCIVIDADGNLVGATQSTTDDNQLFQLVYVEDQGAYVLYNESRKLYAARTKADNTKVGTVTDIAQAGYYTLDSNINGESTLVCINNTGSHTALHLDGYNSVVPWNATGSPASLWYIEPKPVPLAVETIEVSNEAGNDEPELLFDLFGRRVITDTPAHGIYVTSKGRKVVK